METVCLRCAERPPGPDDTLCPACRETVASWYADERLSALAQQGFLEAMGAVPPAGLQFPGLPEDAGLRVDRVRPGAGMTPQQVTGWPDGVVTVTGPDRVAIPAGAVRCRHCSHAITAGEDGAWADAAGHGVCFGDVPHEPLPGGLDGSAG